MNAISSLCPSCLQQIKTFPCSKCKWQNGNNNPPSLLPIGTILDDRYHVAKVLGQGGFGVTYLAWEENLQQRLAIKEYFPRDAAIRATDGTSISFYSNDTQTIFDYGLERFLEEARILAKPQLDQHPNIVSTRAFFRANCTGYMVMEYIDGITMRQYLDRCPGKKIPFERAVTLLNPVMNALQTVHKEGLLHRDIAPDNIYITNDKQVKVLDFGAARFATGEKSQSLSVILKPGYAPEEQYRSRGKQGPWTDVYALAATLYRVTTGKVPPGALDRLNEDDLIPPSRLGIGILPAKEEALLKALSVRADERFQTMLAFQQALQGDGIGSNPIIHTVPTINKSETSTSIRHNSSNKTNYSLINSNLNSTIDTEEEQLANSSPLAWWILPIIALAFLAVLIGIGIYFLQQYAPTTQQRTQTNFVTVIPTAVNEPQMLTLSAGCYQMGTPNNAAERRDNETEHKVCVSAFKLSRYEVTNKEFRRFHPEHDSKDFEGHSLNEDDQPVVAVSWAEALAYANWLSEKTGKLYRLPTEAEWEYAARAGTSTARFWGNNTDDACQYANVHDQTSFEQNKSLPWAAHNCNDGQVVTARVGSFKANAWGLYDMLGNVWEWTCSQYNINYAGNEKRCADPNQIGSIAVRGGAWSSGPASIRSAYRNDWSPDSQLDGLGFRLAQDY